MNISINYENLFKSVILMLMCWAAILVIYVMAALGYMLLTQYTVIITVVIIVSLIMFLGAYFELQREDT